MDLSGEEERLELLSACLAGSRGDERERLPPAAREPAQRHERDRLSVRLEQRAEEPALRREAPVARRPVLPVHGESVPPERLREAPPREDRAARGALGREGADGAVYVDRDPLLLGLRAWRGYSFFASGHDAKRSV